MPTFGASTLPCLATDDVGDRAGSLVGLSALALLPGRIGFPPRPTFVQGSFLPPAECSESLSAPPGVSCLEAVTSGTSPTERADVGGWSPVMPLAPGDWELLAMLCVTESEAEDVSSVGSATFMTVAGEEDRAAG